ncbi:hypothetical protein, partial [Umezakia ovalisporum]|uniref:hypothetical protein n=1 Tax=Umezakia ovalisporum TaxID=75695 RepID=UPI0039C64223
RFHYSHYPSLKKLGCSQPHQEYYSRSGNNTPAMEIALKPQVLNVKKEVIKIAQNMVNSGRRIKKNN